MSTSQTSKFTVNGKVAIVTGAGSGICYEFAKLLLEKGCSVVIGDLSLRPEAEELLKEYQKSPRAIFQRTDVTNWSDLSSLFATAVAEFGSFELVCPGAGVFEPPASTFFHPPGGADSLSRDATEGRGHYMALDVNITHPIRVTQLALVEYLSPSEGGTRASSENPKRIVHVASTLAQGAHFAAPLYIASKHALNGFVRSLAHLEDLFGVRVNAVCPGLVRTPLWTDHPEKLKALDMERDVHCTPREVAELMLQLAESPGYAGGDMVEIGGGKTRKVPLLGNPGPSGPGFTMSNGASLVQDNVQLLSTPGWGKPAAK